MDKTYFVKVNESKETFRLGLMPEIKVKYMNSGTNFIVQWESDNTEYFITFLKESLTFTLFKEKKPNGNYKGDSLFGQYGCRPI